MIDESQKENSDEYREGWERIFGLPAPQEDNVPPKGDA